MLDRAKDLTVCRTLFGGCCLTAERRGGNDDRRCEDPKSNVVQGSVPNSQARPGGAHACFLILGPQRLTAADVPTVAGKQGKARVNAQAERVELGDGDPRDVTGKRCACAAQFTARKGNGTASSLFC